MDIDNQLVNAKTEVLKQIAEAAQRGKSQEVSAAAEKLTKIDSLMEKYQGLLRDIAELETHDNKAKPIQKPTAYAGSSIWSSEHQDLAGAGDESGRGAGRAIRMVFLTKAERLGVHLAYVKGIIYATPAGHRVGIAVATERNADRWFLGLTGDGFDDAVLLCRPKTGDIVEIILPKSFFDEYGRRMGRSRSQILFNVTRRGRDYVLLVPGTGGVNVTKFIGAYSTLK